MRTAILRGLRPTTLLLNKQPRSRWSPLDYILLPAYQIFEDEMSKNTGMPIWITRNLDPNIQLTVEERVDEGDRLLAEWDKKNSGDKKKLGVSRMIVALDADGKPLEYGGLTRQHFREAAIQEQQDQADGIDIDRKRPPEGYNPSDYGDG